jgi:ribosome-binding protein aMBF1 (putative translation factor)
VRALPPAKAKKARPSQDEEPIARVGSSPGSNISDANRRTLCRVPSLPQVYRAVTESKSPSSPPRGMPTPSALLDLTKAGERRVEAFMRWAATCATTPLWSAFRGQSAKQRACRRCRVAGLATLTRSATGPRRAFAVGRVHVLAVVRQASERSRAGDGCRRCNARITVSQRFGDVLRQRRESAGLTQTELASAAKLSTTTIANLESGRNTPAALTVASLRNVAALKLGVALPQYAEPQSVAQR